MHRVDGFRFAVRGGDRKDEVHRRAAGTEILSVHAHSGVVGGNGVPFEGLIRERNIKGVFVDVRVKCGD